jgi:hypothetical protein
MATSVEKWADPRFPPTIDIEEWDTLLNNMLRYGMRHARNEGSQGSYIYKAAMAMKNVRDYYCPNLKGVANEGGRTFPEVVVGILSGPSRGKMLGSRIEELRYNGRASREVISSLEALKEYGNRCSHVDMPDVEPREKPNIIEHMVVVARFLCSEFNILSTQPPPPPTLPPTGNTDMHKKVLSSLAKEKQIILRNLHLWSAERSRLCSEGQIDIQAVQTATDHGHQLEQMLQNLEIWQKRILEHEQNISALQRVIPDMRNQMKQAGNTLTTDGLERATRIREEVTHKEEVLKAEQEKLLQLRETVITISPSIPPKIPPKSTRTRGVAKSQKRARCHYS